MVKAAYMGCGNMLANAQATMQDVVKATNREAPSLRFFSLMNIEM